MPACGRARGWRPLRGLRTSQRHKPGLRAILPVARQHGHSLTHLIFPTSGTFLGAGPDFRWLWAPDTLDRHAHLGGLLISRPVVGSNTGSGSCELRKCARLRLNCWPVGSTFTVSALLGARLHVSRSGGHLTIGGLPTAEIVTLATRVSYPIRTAQNLCRSEHSGVFRRLELLGSCPDALNIQSDSRIRVGSK